MQQPLLTPPKHVPFTIQQSSSGVVITVEKDAAHHHGLAELRAIVWIRGVTVPVHVNLAQVTLLSSALIGWMFGLIHEGKLRTLCVSQANRRVQMQMQQVGLSGFVTLDASTPMVATVSTAADAAAAVG